MRLQTEENGTKIAQLQGYITGTKIYKKLMDAAGFVNIYTDDREEMFLSIDENGDEECSLNPQGVEYSNIMAQALILMPEYKDFQKNREAKIEEAKNNLFFYSDKTRDLYWYRGWYEAITQVDDYIHALNAKFELLKQKKEQAAKQVEEELPFEDMGA